MQGEKIRAPSGDKKNLAPLVPRLSAKISIWRKTVSKTLGDLGGMGMGV